jgi:hypothetical protein
MADKLLRERLDDIFIESVKLALEGCKKEESFSYKKVENILVKGISIYRDKLAEVIKLVSLEPRK